MKETRIIAESRVGGLGGSDAKLVLKAGQGLAFSKTDITRLGVMMGKTPFVGFGGNAATEAGHKFEGYFEQFLKDAKAVYERERELVYQHSLALSYKVFAHADFAVSKDGELVIYECKYSQVATEEVAEKYKAQLQWYYLLGADRVVLVHGRGSVEPFDVEDVKMMTIEREDDIIDTLRVGLCAVEEYINSEDFNGLEWDEEAKAVNADELPIFGLIEEMVEIKTKIATLETRMKELSEALASYRDETNDYRTINAENVQITYVSASERRSLDAKKVKEMLGEKIEECYKVIQVKGHDAIKYVNY